jgi:hypothetical protein
MARSSALLAALLLAGCSGTQGLFNGSAPQGGAPETNDGGGETRFDSNNLGFYLETLRDLVEGDAVAQADAFRTAEQAVESAPTTSNRLNLAMALATPGHPSSNPALAQRMLNELLAAGDSLLPEERILATVHLKEVEHWLILDAEAERLQRAAAAASAARNDQSAQRLQAALEENRRLQLELDEARAKLNAITDIERTIRERENGSTPR